MSNKAEEKEIWRVYPKIPFIEASNLGRIRTKDRYVPLKNGGKQFIKGRVLKQQLNRDNHMYVQFRANGKKVYLPVHRIVATCFIPNPNNLPEVNHIDNDPTNNAVSNLEWCTKQYNLDYKKNFGTTPAEVLGRPVIAVNPDTSEVFWFETQTEAAQQLDVNRPSITNVVNGKHKTTGGYWFCYADENAVEKARENFGDEIAKKVEELMKHK